MSMFFEEATEEEIAEAKRERARAEMRSQEITARVMRLIAEELTYDQLEVLHAMMGHVGNSGSPVVIANWYEGLAKGAMAVRDVVLGQKTVDVDGR